MYQEPNSASGMLYLYKSPKKLSNLLSPQNLRTPRNLLSPSFSGSLIVDSPSNDSLSTKQLLLHHPKQSPLKPNKVTSQWMQIGAHTDEEFTQPKVQVMDDSHPVPDRMNDLLSRMQTGLVTYENTEKQRGGLMSRVFKVRTLEQKIYPSINQHNRRLQQGL